MTTQIPWESCLTEANSGMRAEISNKLSDDADAACLQSTLNENAWQHFGRRSEQEFHRKRITSGQFCFKKERNGAQFHK